MSGSWVKDCGHWQENKTAEEELPDFDEEATEAKEEVKDLCPMRSSAAWSSLLLAQPPRPKMRGPAFIRASMLAAACSPSRAPMHSPALWTLGRL